MPSPLRPNPQYDYVLNGKGYMLVRQPPQNARSWDRRGTADIPYRFYQWSSGPYDPEPPEIDRTGVFNDWSGGYGHAYREAPDDNFYLYAQNFDTRWPKQLIHSQTLQYLPNTRYSGSNVNCEYLTDVPLLGVASPPAGAGAILAYGANWATSFAPTSLLAAGSQFDMRTESSGQTFAERPALFGSFTYVATGTGFWQRKFDGTTATMTQLLPSAGFATYRNVMWRRFGGPGNLLQSVAAGADPTNTANWSATLNIGNGLNGINDMMERGDALFLGMDDGLYQGDISGTFFNVLPEARDVRHADNGRDLTAYDGGVVFAGAPGQYWYQPAQFGGARGDAFEVGAQAVTTGQNPVRGRIRAQQAFGPWLYAGMWTGSQSWLLAGRRADARTQPSPYEWHTMQLLPDTAKIHRIHLDGITNASGQYNEMPTRLWIATEGSFGAQTGATSPLYVCPVPRLNQNPLLDPSFTANYCGSARIDFPYDDFQMPGVLKVYRAVEIWADNLQSGAQYANVFATIDNGARIFIGQANQSPKSTIYFPGDNGTFLTGLNVKLSLESYTASAGITPVYRSVVIRGPVRPRSVDVCTAQTWIADNVVDRMGVVMRPGADQITELRALADPLQMGNKPVQLTDIAGATQWVVVLPSIAEVEFRQDGDRNPEIMATVKMAVLDFTQSAGPGIALQSHLWAQGGRVGMR